MGCSIGKVPLDCEITVFVDGPKHVAMCHWCLARAFESFGQADDFGTMYMLMRFALRRCGTHLDTTKLLKRKDDCGS